MNSRGMIFKLIYRRLIEAFDVAQQSRVRAHSSEGSTWLKPTKRRNRTTSQTRSTSADCVRGLRDARPMIVCLDVDLPIGTTFEFCGGIPSRSYGNPRWWNGFYRT